MWVGVDRAPARFKFTRRVLITTLRDWRRSDCPASLAATRPRAPRRGRLRPNAPLAGPLGPARDTARRTFVVYLGMAASPLERGRPVRGRNRSSSATSLDSGLRTSVRSGVAVLPYPLINQTTTVLVHTHGKSRV